MAVFLMNINFEINNKCGAKWINIEKWGDVICPDFLEVKKRTKKEKDLLKETYEFINIQNKEVIIKEGQVGIYVPFNDNYAGADICLMNRCHTHIWCGGTSSYIRAVRMGGTAPHIGLVLTKGSLIDYSIERNFKNSSEDRGMFIVHPEKFALKAGEKYIIEWVLFTYENEDDFYNKASEIGNYIDIKAQNYVLFQNEKIQIDVLHNKNVNMKDICIIEKGRKIHANIFKGKATVTDEADTVGEREYIIKTNCGNTKAVVNVIPELSDLIHNRCSFIVSHQQNKDKKSHLYGAYVVYDNETDEMVYDKNRVDINAGRERIGMGVLITHYLRKHYTKEVYESMCKYFNFLEREIFDTRTGHVYNDVKHDEICKRLYNYPWVALLYYERYLLENDKEFLRKALLCMREFYKEGGERFYAFLIPADEICTACRKEKIDCDNFMKSFLNHADCILKNDLNYPPHEVKFEQSIVAPAAEILLSAFSLTGDEKYLIGAKKQIKVLELFAGHQPDYRLYEAAIRHWDAYWFGKSLLFGDTFPHYWSALSGRVYYKYYKITSDKKFLKRAEYSFRNVLSLFEENGRAHCAYVYPFKVNKTKGKFYDAYANDQDWGMYFAADFFYNEKEIKEGDDYI